MQEGFVELGGRRTWFRAIGEPTDLPALLVLHGGPGGGSANDHPFAATIARERQIVMYDQIESGRSQRLGDPSALTIDNFIAELDAVRAAFGLERVHVMGESWGGMLAMEYALTRPAGLVSIITAGSPFSTAQWMAAATEFRAALPSRVQRALARCEATIARHPRLLKVGGEPTEAKVAKKAQALSKQSKLALAPPVQAIGRAMSYLPPLRRIAYDVVGFEFVHRHVIRMTPVPAGAAAQTAASNLATYEHLWGPSEFEATGPLREWDITDRLAEIDTPMLITSGAYECVTPAHVRAALSQLPSAQWVLFEHSAHVSSYEEPERFTTVLQEFLTKTDGR